MFVPLTFSDQCHRMTPTRDTACFQSLNRASYSSLQQNGLLCLRLSRMEYLAASADSAFRSWPHGGGIPFLTESGEHHVLEASHRLTDLPCGCDRDSKHPASSGSSVHCQGHGHSVGCVPNVTLYTAGKLWMNRKRLPALLLPSCGQALCVCMLLAISLCGCQSENAADAPLRLRMAHVYEVSAPTHAYGTAHLAENLQKSGSDMQVTVYPAAQLGSEEELLEQLVAGELDLAISGPSFLAMWHPPLGVFDAAFASRDLDHLLELASGKEMAPHWEELRKKYDVRVLDTWAYGSRHITSNRPIRHPDDLKGFRLRMPAARVWQASGEALGASPMPISFSEVYLALQQGIADGQENPVPVIKAKGFHEVQKCLNLSGHIQSSIQILMNERAWQKLNTAQQNSLMKAVQELGKDVYRGIVEDEKRLIEEWRKNGTMQIVEDVDVDAFRARARKHFSSGFAFSELYNRITSESVEGQP